MSTTHRLRRVKAILPGFSNPTQDPHPTNDAPITLGSAKTILRILIKDPWNDYDYIEGYVEGRDPVILAKHKAFYFRLVTIRQLHLASTIPVEILSTIQHPNITSICDIYRYSNKTFLVTEHLQVGISQLEIQKYELEEWEIATIIAEV